MSRRDSNASDIFVTGDLIVVARQSGGAFDCRARRGATGATGFFDGDLSPVAVDVHFEDRRMMNQTIDGGQGYGLIGKNPSPFAEGLIGGDQHRSPLVSRADQFEQNAGFRLILGDIGEVVENQQMASRGELSPSALSDPSVRLSPHSAPIK